MNQHPRPGSRFVLTEVEQLEVGRRVAAFLRLPLWFPYAPSDWLIRECCRHAGYLKPIHDCPDCEHRAA